jgi:hypothetical protein
MDFVDGCDHNKNTLEISVVESDIINNKSACYIYRLCHIGGNFIKAISWLPDLPNDKKININMDEAYRKSCVNSHYKTMELLLITKRICNETVNKNYKHYNNEIIKLIFDIGYTPLNDGMRKYYQEYNRTKHRIKQDVGKYLILDLTDIIYEYY